MANDSIEASKTGSEAELISEELGEVVKSGRKIAVMDNPGVWKMVKDENSGAQPMDEKPVKPTKRGRKRKVIDMDNKRLIQEGPGVWKMPKADDSGSQTIDAEPAKATKKAHPIKVIEID
jgi:hypothetical protein